MIKKDDDTRYCISCKHRLQDEKNFGCALGYWFYHLFDDSTVNIEYGKVVRPQNCVDAKAKAILLHLNNALY
jgi:hypothetical protein